MEASKNVVHRTGHVDPLWGEIVVLAAYSDWGEKGWLVCNEFRRTESSKPSYHPKVFFQVDARDEAIKCADEMEVGT